MPKLLVTGFIGGHVARVALLSGLAVRGTVRGTTHGIDKVLTGLEVVKVDLLHDSEAELVAAMSGCTYLAHVASPFPGGDVTDDEMRTALEGTAKVLRAAAAAGVKRVVLTSSVAAIGGSEDKAKGTASRPFTAEDWSPETMPSSLGLEMTTIHPSFVNGPLLLPRSPTSTAMAKRILEGSMPAVPAIGMNVCGVQDVAEAHVKAVLDPSTAGQRLIVAAGNLLMTDLAVAIKEAHPGWPIKTARIPWVAMWLYSFFDKQAAGVLPMWKKESYYDVSAAEQLLGRPLQPPMEAALEMAASIIELGVASRPQGAGVGAVKEES
ncbi:hypothetical protein EMIHUDRAFT_254037 [Emiliania huxleyi CCMP1516]|uniref:NAD-dependent epimerase/dehydratase domain-containing protein n=2 Tax=Emiliania huxleyi TaxID=2903 RepID=A0A0D3JZ74_EMIH1|nr:hypothetical protein EMIHUDRAFT_254037 [Emiliania huxleyi CCMP1516]EOD28809.1 hypothetical protein EMIHUDRAFT_254037 [Emiliania huxleyi CCMP1516]|eukprot:XP_005781238.1 hypothetical protein EMIHUDRAFT_254037 [Emiliania huxleyi CCMP1516]